MTSLAERAAARAPGLLIARARERSGSLVLGFHSSLKKGSGIDFVSHRAYSPGDDLRHIDRHALARHHKLLIREFEREAKRPLVVVFDSSVSMTYRSPAALESKLARAAFLAATTAFVASRGRDPLGLLDLGKSREFTGAPRSGLAHRDLVLEHLAEYGGEPPELGETSLEPLRENLGAIPSAASVLWFSDFFTDLPSVETAVTELATRGRSVALVQVCDPAELGFPFTGPLHLTTKSGAGTREIVTSAERTRATYLERFSAHTDGLRRIIEAHRGTFARLSTEASDAASIAALNQAFLGAGT